MDCTVSTGAAAMMAVRVLLVGAPSCSQQCQCLLCKWIAHVDHFSQLCFQFQDHDVQEDKILLVSLLMAEMGVHSVAYAFPQVKIITTAVDKKVNDLFHIIPGIGEQCWGSRKDRTVLKSLKCKNKHCSTVFIFFYRCRLLLFFRKLWRSVFWNRRTAWLEWWRHGWAQLLNQLLSVDLLFESQGCAPGRYEDIPFAPVWLLLKKKRLKRRKMLLICICLFFFK